VLSVGIEPSMAGRGPRVEGGDPALDGNPVGIVEDVVGREVTVVEWCDPAPDVALLGVGIELVERGITVVKECSTPPC
jgi:hypothetical protein